jgi:hypothetical protein
LTPMGARKVAKFRSSSRPSQEVPALNVARGRDIT